MLWWLQVACINHGFAQSGFERCLARIGPVMQPIVALLNRRGNQPGPFPP